MSGSMGQGRRMTCRLTAAIQTSGSALASVGQVRACVLWLGVPASCSVSLSPARLWDTCIVQVRCIRGVRLLATACSDSWWQALSAYECIRRVVRQKLRMARPSLMSVSQWMDVVHANMTREASRHVRGDGDRLQLSSG